MAEHNTETNKNGQPSIQYLPSTNFETAASSHHQLIPNFDSFNDVSSSPPLQHSMESSMNDFVDIAYNKPFTGFDTELQLSPQASTTDFVDVGYNEYIMESSMDQYDNHLLILPNIPSYSNNNNKDNNYNGAKIKYTKDSTNKSQLSQISHPIDSVLTPPIKKNIINNNDKSECIFMCDSVQSVNIEIDDVNESKNEAQDGWSGSDWNVTPNTVNSANTENNSFRKKNIPFNIEDFNNDSLAYNTWLNCCNIYDESTIYLDALYPELMKIWKEHTKCQRLPSYSDIQPIFVRLGGQVLFDHDDVCIMKKDKYLKFWKWYKNVLVLMHEIKYLWDSFKLNLFLTRQQSETALSHAKTGTFILRISATMTSSLIVSYVVGSNHSNKSIKHVILKRISPFKFMVHKQKNGQQTTLHHLIRSFVKLKYIYCDHNRIYSKSAVF